METEVTLTPWGMRGSGTTYLTRLVDINLACNAAHEETHKHGVPRRTTPSSLGEGFAVLKNPYAQLISSAHHQRLREPPEDVEGDLADVPREEFRITAGAEWFWSKLDESYFPYALDLMEWARSGLGIVIPYHHLVKHPEKCIDRIGTAFGVPRDEEHWFTDIDRQQGGGHRRPETFDASYYEERRYLDEFPTRQLLESIRAHIHDYWEAEYRELGFKDRALEREIRRLTKND